MNIGRTLVLGFAKLWAFIACFLAVTACASAGNGKINIGDKMDDFTLNDTDGRPHSLYQSKWSHATVVIFIATQCPYSNAFNHVMEQLYEEYQGKAVGFVAINANRTEPAAEVAQHAKAKGLKFLILKDEGSAIANRLGARATPEVYLLDSNMVLQYHGALGNSKHPTTNPALASSDEAKPAIEAVLAGKPVSVQVTKAFGCSIKR